MVSGDGGAFCRSSRRENACGARSANLVAVLCGGVAAVVLTDPTKAPAELRTMGTYAAVGAGVGIVLAVWVLSTHMKDRFVRKKVFDRRTGKLISDTGWNFNRTVHEGELMNRKSPGSAGKFVRTAILFGVLAGLAVFFIAKWR